MFLTDYHVHSDVSQDSKASMYDMVMAEAAMGIEQMCFTNHCDMCHWRTYELNPWCVTQVPASLVKYQQLMQEHPDLPIDVRLGIELGEPLFNIDIAKAIASSPGLDMVMGSLHILLEYGDHILGRMGIPYRKRGVNIISIALDAPQDTIASLSGKIGRLDGVSVKTAYSNVITQG